MRKNSDIKLASKELKKNLNHNPDKHQYINSKDKKSSQIFTELSCDVCKSVDILETKEGYVCKNCGIVLELQKLEYHNPYNYDSVQYAKLGTTQIGFIRERLQNERSVQLEKLNKLQSIKSNKEAVLEEAKIEINRIFTGLNLPVSLKGMVFKNFKKIRAALKPGTKYRTPDKLVPLTIYLVFKFQNVSINEAELLEISKILKKDFNAFKLQILHIFPQYQVRNRKKYILQKLTEISEHFQLGMTFYFQCKKILYKLWDNIKNTKDDVIAGLIASISILCSYEDKNVSVSSICNKLGIKMSTIQSQVKRRIFNEFKISGFTTLIKSADLLKQVMEKKGLLEANSTLWEKKINDKTEIQSSKVKPKLSNLKEKPDFFNYVDYHSNSLKNNNGFPKYLFLNCFNRSIGFNIQQIAHSSDAYTLENKERELYDLELLKSLANKEPSHYK